MAGIPGTIGHAQTEDVATYPGSVIPPVDLDGLGDNFVNVGTGARSYRSWAVEYLYIYGSPPPSSLSAAFLAHRALVIVSSRPARFRSASIFSLWPDGTQSVNCEPAVTVSARDVVLCGSIALIIWRHDVWADHDAAKPDGETVRGSL